MAANRLRTIRPLWQLLASACHPGNNATLTCEECCAVLEYYADRIAAGADPDEVGQVVRRHLEVCPDCHEKYSDWLDEIERGVRQDLEQEIADLEVRLAALKARRPARSVPPPMIVDIDELEGRLADARVHLRNIQSNR